MTEFPNLQGFLDWLGVGNSAGLPYSHKADAEGKKVPTGWKLQFVDGEVVITSPWYEVREKVPNGNPKIWGFLVSAFGVKPSGVIEFGFTGETFGKQNRRRAVPNEQLKDGQIVVAVTNDAAPDRLEEPVAVLAFEADKDRIAALSGDERCRVYDTLRDGVEMEALRRVWRWADQK